MKVIEVQLTPVPTKHVPARPERCHVSTWKVFATAFVVAAAGAWVVNYDTPKPVRPVVKYKVVAGDTLWSIASAYGSDHADIRKTYWQIAEDNHIPLEGTLQPGQTLVINQ